ncbi:MAG: ATP-binding cassette domain-containing protein [Streptosporangiales bacterium]
MAARVDAGGAGRHPAPGPAATAAQATETADGADVVIESVGKTFRRSGHRTVALAGVDLEVRAGELVCLLGPSGCGKSTLLRIIAGALASDEGTVTVGGHPVDGPSPDRGMLFQTPMLFPWLTTRKNVLFGPKAQRAAGLNERMTRNSTRKPTPSWTPSGWPGSVTPSRMSCPAACGTGRLSPGR